MTNQTNTIESKFQSLVYGSTHLGLNGVCGTNQDVRQSVWNEFRTTFKDGVFIKVNGIGVNLCANHSLSGKSTSFKGVISKDDFIAITGSSFGLTDKPYAMIDLGTLTVYGGGKFFTKIENKLVNFK